MARWEGRAKLKSSQNTDSNVSDPQMEEYYNYRGPPQEASYLSCISDVQDWVCVGRGGIPAPGILAPKCLGMRSSGT